MLRRTLVLCLLLAEPAAARSVDEVVACMRANLPSTTSVQTVAFDTVDRIGAHSKSEAKLSWKRGDDGLSKVMVRFLSPSDLRGAGLLLIEKRERLPDQFMYLPELGRTRRVSTRMMSSSLFGTDFSYEDFTRLQGMAIDSSLRLKADAEIDGVAVHVLERTPDAELGSGYERIVEYVDTERCVPLKTEMYEKGDRLRKTSSTPRDRVEKEGEHWVPRSVLMHDTREGTSTTLEVIDVEVGGEIHRKVFTQQYLQSRD